MLALRDGNLPLTSRLLLEPRSVAGFEGRRAGTLAQAHCHGCRPDRPAVLRTKDETVSIGSHILLDRDICLAQSSGLTH